MEQAHRSFTTSSFDASAVMCGRALEALCNVLSAKGSTLYERLASLRASGKIDDRLLAWAHGVRIIRNGAAHDVDTATTLEDARDALDFTEALLTYIFVLDARFREFETRRRGTSR